MKLKVILQDSLNEPVLVSGADGVWTKIMIASYQKKYDTIGIDVIAMNVNDIKSDQINKEILISFATNGTLLTSEKVKSD